MRENSWLRDYGALLLTGVVVGVAALVLTACGNPANMGFCIACFERDIAGALGLHSAAKEFRAKAGSSPACRFLLGLFVMIGALVFLGCPLRMVIRLGGGDLTAVAGLLGFIAGIGVGVVCLRKGFSLGRAYPVRSGEGMALPLILVIGLVLLLAFPLSLIHI